MRFVISALLAFGITSTAYGRQETGVDSEPKQAVMQAPPTGKGQVVFFRKGGIMGAAISCAVHENGAKLSSLPPGKFAALNVDPGAHDYSVQSEATSTLHLDVVAGRTYYAQCSIGMGIMAGHPHLKLTGVAAFQKMQAKLKPVVPKA